jgi:hypothetical protein
MYTAKAASEKHGPRQRQESIHDFQLTYDAYVHVQDVWRVLCHFMRPALVNNLLDVLVRVHSAEITVGAKCNE